VSELEGRFDVSAVPGSSGGGLKQAERMLAQQTEETRSSLLILLAAIAFTAPSEYYCREVYCVDE